MGTSQGIIPKWLSNGIPGQWKKEVLHASEKVLTTIKYFDGFGRIVRIELPGSKYQETRFDGFGQKISQTPMMTGNQNSYGRFTWNYDYQGRATTSSDPQGRPLSEVTFQAACSTLTKDGQTLSGVITTTKDDQGYTRSIVTDLLGQKSAVVDQDGKVSLYYYDKNGHLGKTDQGGQVRQYVFNDLGWLLSRTEPEEGATTYGRFNMLGMPTRTTMLGRNGASSVNTIVTLDAHLRASRLITSAIDSPAVDRQITYFDAFHVPHSVIESQVNGTITETYELDAAGRYRTKITTDGIESFTVNRTLDALGNPLTLTYPSGGGRAAQVLTTIPDEFFRPKTLYLDASRRAQVDYDLVSGTAVSSVLVMGESGSTIQTTSTVDKGELSQVDHAAMAGTDSFIMSWTPGGLMKSRGPDSFEYDALQRLRTATIAGLPGTPQAGKVITQQFDYDRYGNRTRNWATMNTGNLAEISLEVRPWLATYEVTNSLPATVTPLDTDGNPVTGTALATGRQYDNLGRLTTIYAIPGIPETITNWTYDATGRVISENGSTFTLDPGGLRFRRLKPDGSTSYTVYGFNQEPLMVFEKASPAGTSMLAKGSGSKSSGSIASGSSSKSVAMQALSGGTTLAIINDPSTNITVWTGQAIPFSGADESPWGSTLSWNFGDGIRSTGTGPSVSHTYTKTGAFTVTLTASAPGWQSSSASLIVTVVARPTVSLTVNPSSIVNGDPTTLTWSTTGGAAADTRLLSPAPGSVGASGTSQQRPSVTTLYSLTMGNDYGTVTSSSTVTVNNPPPPIISNFKAQNGSLNQGQSTTLSWTVTGNANWPITVTLRTDMGSTSTSTQMGVSSLQVAPSETATYTLAASNAFGTALQQVTVNVLQKPVIASFWAEPSVVQPGGTVTLKWRVSNFASLSIPGLSPGTGSSITITPYSTMQYTLSATNAAGTVSSSPLTVTVSSAPPVLAWQRSMVYGFGQLISEETVTGVRYMQSDQVGTPNRILDSDGNVVGRSKTLPFGERFGRVGYSSIRRYTNHEETEESAIYMQARTYLPAYGKFAQVDPAYDQTKDDPETWNLYNYVTNNPVTHTDPDGRELVEVQIKGMSVKVDNQQTTGSRLVFDKQFVTKFSEFLKAVDKLGYSARITSTFRTKAVAEGLKKTNANATKGVSYHRAGLAVDIFFTKTGGKESALGSSTNEVVKAATDAGLSWGGSWNTGPEDWHFELKLDAETKDKMADEADKQFTGKESEIKKEDIDTSTKKDDEKKDDSTKTEKTPEKSDTKKDEKSS